MKYIVMWEYFCDGDFASGMTWGISEHCSVEDAEEEFEEVTRDRYKYHAKICKVLKDNDTRR